MKAITAIILVVISVALFFFQVNPMYADVKILRAESEQYDQALQIAQELEVIRGELATKLSSFSASELQRLEVFMPQRLDTVRVILDVNGIADNNDIEIKDIRTADSAKTGPGPASAQPQSPYNTTSVSFSFTTTYAGGERFIADLERSLRLIDIVAVNVKPSASRPGSYDFGMTLNTYWVGKR